MPELQAEWVSLVLESAQRYQFAFVVNFVLRNYDVIWEMLGALEDISIAWRDTGLYDEADEACPLIYCAMGSSGNEHVVKRIIEAFEGTPYNVIAPVGFHLDRIDVRVPDNVMVTGWLPAPQVNPLEDIAVIHRVQSTVQTACVSGTPFVGIGMQPEQEANIAFLVRRGCAIRIGRREVSREKLISAIDKLLHDGEAKRIAKGVQANYAAWDGAQRSATFLRARFAE